MHEHDPAILIEPSPATGEFDGAPDRRAVVVLESSDGRALLIATTASARRFIDRRFSAAPPPGGTEARGGRADLRAVTSRVVVHPAASALESDLLYRDLILRRLAALYPMVSRRWRTWWIGIDPAAAVPTWSCRTLEDPPPIPADRHAGSAESHVSATAPLSPLGALTGGFLGPFDTREAAVHATESIVDLFDLCREERLLAQAPRATACVYKEMGRCAAPCDGSESMASFRGRVAEALEFASHVEGPGWRDRMAEQRRACAARQDFEGAGAAHAMLRRGDDLLAGPLGLVSSPATYNWLIAMRGASPGALRVIRIDGRRLRPLGDYAADDAPLLLEQLSAPSAAVTAGWPLTADAVGIVFRHLRRGVDRASAGVRWLRLSRDGVPDEASLRALLAALRERAPASDDDDQEESATQGP